MYECVVNLAEGRRREVLDELAAAAGSSLRDRHVDAHHHRSVFTLINDADELVSDVHALLALAFTRLDLRGHAGVHPRLGVVDVVPFVALDGGTALSAETLRDDTGHWIAERFAVPVFFYGPRADESLRTLPDVRRHAFVTLAPDVGPTRAHPTRGASAVGARAVMVAWNLWLEGVAHDEVRALARAVRSYNVRALAFDLGEYQQLSCNLLEPLVTGPSVVYDRALALCPHARVARSELVGLIPAALLEHVSRDRWSQLDLGPNATIESRLG